MATLLGAKGLIANSKGLLKGTSNTDPSAVTENRENSAGKDGDALSDVKDTE